MSTRCLTRIFDGQRELCTLYRHCDGYPEGHGADLAAFVKHLRVVNGHSSRSTLKKAVACNGSGRLAARIISHFTEVGIDVYHVGSSDCGEEYEYHVMSPRYDELFGKPDGLPVTVRCYQVTGGYNGKERTLCEVVE